MPMMLNHEVQFIAVLHPGQIVQTAALAQQIWAQYYPPLTGYGQTHYMLEHYQSTTAISQQIQQGYHYFLVQQTTTAIGYFALRHDTAASSVQLSKIYLTEDHRRQGYGGNILNFVENWCRQRAACELWLTVNRHNQLALAFYHKMGLRITNPLIQDIGHGFVMDDYRMAKPIDREECKNE